MSVLLRNIKITDCSKALKGDVLIEEGQISAIGEHLPSSGEQVIDGEGRLTLLPSFVDLHAHFRDPGLTYKEDVETGCRAAVHGGYGAVNLMPNTKPVCSSMETVRYVEDKAKELGLCDVFQTVSITKDFDGKTLDHIETLDKSVKWLTDDGYGVDSTKTILAAMLLAKEKGLGLMLHEEDSALSKTDMYLAEELMTFRDVQLAVLTGCPVHFCHVSTINAMNYIIDGKSRCDNITCEVSPHHLALNDRTNNRVNPPLRGEEHRKYLIECVQKGYVDAIATDHAPHTAEEKQQGMNGFTGLDLAFSTCYTELVEKNSVSLSTLSALMSANPAKLLGLKAGRIEPGLPADLVLVDLDKTFTVTERHIHSKSKNTPLMGKTLRGEVLMTIKGGHVVYEKAPD